MKNLGSRWTVPDIARTAAARSSLLVATSSERDSGSSISSSSSNELRRKAGSNDSGSSSIRRFNEIRKKRSRFERVIADGSSSAAVEVLQEGVSLSVRSYVTASFNLIHGTRRSADEESRNQHRPRNQQSRQKQREHQKKRQQKYQQKQSAFRYSPATSWDERTRHFRNC